MNDAIRELVMNDEFFKNDPVALELLSNGGVLHTNEILGDDIEKWKTFLELRRIAVEKKFKEGDEEVKLTAENSAIHSIDEDNNTLAGEGTFRTR